MAWSADDEYRTRVLSRRHAVVQLRHPGVAYGPAALVLMYATGLIAVLTAATSFSSVDGAAASALVLPAGAATAATALGIGLKLRRYEENSLTAIIVRAGLIWAFFGAAWPLMHVASDILSISSGGDFHHLATVLRATGLQMLAGASVGGIGGLAGGAAATFLCVERAR